VTTPHKYKKKSDILQYPELGFRDTTPYVVLYITYRIRHVHFDIEDWIGGTSSTLGGF
jgi:hypothetical protein